jgi:hypothetical protein
MLEMSLVAEVLLAGVLHLPLPVLQDRPSYGIRGEHNCVGTFAVSESAAPPDNFSGGSRDNGTRIQ